MFALLENVSVQRNDKQAGFGAVYTSREVTSLHTEGLDWPGSSSLTSPRNISSLLLIDGKGMVTLHVSTWATQLALHPQLTGEFGPNTLWSPGRPVRAASLSGETAAQDC